MTEAEEINAAIESTIQFFRQRRQRRIVEAEEVNQILETIANEYVIKGGFSNKYYLKMFAVSFAASATAYFSINMIIGYLARKEKLKEKDNAPTVVYKEN